MWKNLIESEAFQVVSGICIASAVLIGLIVASIMLCNAVGRAHAAEASAQCIRTCGEHGVRIVNNSSYDCECIGNEMILKVDKQ
jgi:hypothetical protein